MKRILLLLHFVLISNFVFSQEESKGIVELKTTEEYYIELPTKGDYISKSTFVKWVFFLDSKFIRFSINDRKYVFDYYKNGSKIIKKESDLLVINFENDKNEIITLVQGNNYIKIKYQTDMEKLTDGSKSFKKVSVFSNYNIDGLYNLLSNEL